MSIRAQHSTRNWWISLLILAIGGPAVAEESDLDFVRRLNAAFVNVAEKVSPSVVVVRVHSKSEPLEGHEEFLQLLPEELRRRWLERLEQQVEQGSGVIIREDGHILTNGHVIENAERIEVRLRDGRSYIAQVRGIDPDSDLAVIKVEATGLTPARLGDSSKLRVGEFAIAIGAPFELDYSVTVGHVSATGRRVMADMIMMDQDFIQTDASINPGNSGGPLVNIEGEVIGINTAIRGLNTGIGFAVPIDLAREVATALIETGRFARAWLGIGILALGRQPDEQPKVPSEHGVVVTRIVPEGPSWGSDLAVNDVIVAVEGTPVRDEAELKRQVSRRPAGKPLRVDVFRGEEKLELTLTPGELPQNRLASLMNARPRRTEPDEVSALGMTVRALDSSNADRVGLSRGEGVLVVNVDDDSPAARQRIFPGDVITKVNRRDIRSLRDFRLAMDGADLQGGVSIIVVGETGRRYEILKASAD